MGKPGETGEPLLGTDSVHRLALVTSDLDESGALLPIAFKFSPAEAKAQTPSLSLWEASLTTPEEAVGLVSNPKRRVVATFQVQVLTSLNNSNTDIAVVWDRLPNASGPELGHCALIGAHRPTKPEIRRIRRLITDQVNASAEIKTLELGAV